MVPEPSAVEQAVSRALRDNLARLQRTTDEVNQAIADLVAACASSRPTNALPAMLRTQTAAASLAAALEVLTRFVTSALHPPPGAPTEVESVRLVGLPSPEPSPPATPAPRTTPVPMGEAPRAAVNESLQAADMIAEGAPVTPVEAAVGVAEAEPEPAATFSLANLSPEEQDLHRRASRVAKVSMQDIKMLRPEQVKLGREHKDICLRLRDDIEKARREYDRRFRTILDHPVDHFYHWMVEILASGDPEALGEYPYPSPVVRR